MWYFAWILGVLLACTLGVINVMWYEFHQHKDSIADDELELYARLKNTGIQDGDQMKQKEFKDLD